MSEVEREPPRRDTDWSGPIRVATPSRWQRAAEKHERTGHWAEAEAQYREGLRERPADMSLFRGLGKALAVQGRLPEALAAFGSAAQLDPGNPIDLCNAGAVLHRMGHAREAIDLLIEVVVAEPLFVQARYNLALSLGAANLVHAAIEQLEAVLALDPGCVNAEFERALLLLMSGDFDRGWREYECRRRHPRCDISRRTLPGPLWDGSDFSGRTLALFEEQGFGDTFQFCRYVPAVKALCGRLVFECRPETERLLAGFEEIDHLVVRGDVLPEYDAQAPLMSLPHLLGTTVDSVPWNGPYLGRTNSNPPPPVDGGSHGDSSFLRVGIAWAGSPDHPNDRNRSASFDDFVPLLDVPGTRIRSLQVGPPREQLFEHPRGREVEDLGSGLGDFQDTAEAIAGMDLVVTVDTCVAHLAGAMGRPVWILLPASPEWRWMGDRSDSPWYPTARLFRQPEPHDWSSVMSAVVRRLPGAA